MFYVNSLLAVSTNTKAPSIKACNYNLMPFLIIQSTIEIKPLNQSDALIKVLIKLNCNSNI